MWVVLSFVLFLLLFFWPSSINEGMNTPDLVSKTTYPNNWNIFIFFGVFTPVCASISVSCWPQEPSGSCLTQCLPVPMSHSQHFPHTYLDVLHHMANQGWDVLQERERLLTSSPGIFRVARLGLQIGIKLWQQDAWMSGMCGDASLTQIDKHRLR